jgi:hypothetical protein
MRTWIGPSARASVASRAADRAPGSGREGHEEGVALGVDLHPAVPGKCLPQDGTVGGQRIGIALGSQGVKQPGRAFDIGEEEGDRAGRKVGGAHAVSRR